jgi:2-dehydropantoate 2-reductase
MPDPGVSLAHWHVLGAGAMGCLFASHLRSADHQVTLVLRQSTAEKALPVRLERDGITHEQLLPVTTALDADPISHLLVTTKAYDVHAAVLGLAHRLDCDSQVLLLVNGMGFADSLRKELPEPDFYFGTTTQGAYRIAAHHIRHAGQGLTRVGAATNTCTETACPGTLQPPAWFGQWSKAVQPSIWDADIEQALWLKLAINCAINPLTAVHRCPNGELAQRPELAAEVARLCDEIQRISVVAGFAEITRDLHNTVAGVIANTADNRSSMLQDVLAGRRTEIDYITGQLLRIASAHAIEAPANAALLRRILELDH